MSAVRGQEGQMPDFGPVATHLHPRDDVATAKRPLEAGMQLNVSSGTVDPITIMIRERVPTGTS